jgi:hypothetical protein
MVGYLLMVVSALCGFVNAPIWSVLLVAMVLTLSAASKHRQVAVRYSQLGSARVFGTSFVMILSNNFIFCLISYGLGHVASALIS